MGALHMDKEQATTIIILLAAILFVMLAGRTVAVELLGNLFWVGVVILIVASVLLLARDWIRDWMARSYAKERQNNFDHVGLTFGAGLRHKPTWRGHRECAAATSSRLA